ncbi:MAG: hypothetical protein ABMA15_23095 [Vicinamibacterales bacterium]
MFAMILLLAAVLGQQPPAPQPFPKAGTQQPAAPAAPPTQPPATPPRQPAPAPEPEAAQGQSQLGVQMYPGSQFLASYDAGRGQRYYLFGTTGSFADVVTFYRNVLKQRGELIFDAPATHQFDIGRFREETMAFPPSVTVKEFQSQISQGYPNPRPNGEPARFPTVIQVVPVVTP